MDNFIEVYYGTVKEQCASFNGTQVALTQCQFFNLQGKEEFDINFVAIAGEFSRFRDNNRQYFRPMLDAGMKLLTVRELGLQRTLEKEKSKVNIE